MGNVRGCVNKPSPSQLAHLFGQLGPLTFGFHDFPEIRRFISRPSERQTAGKTGGACNSFRISGAPDAKKRSKDGELKYSCVFPPNKFCCSFVVLGSQESPSPPTPRIGMNKQKKAIAALLFAFASCLLSGCQPEQSVRGSSTGPSLEDSSVNIGTYGCGNVPSDDALTPAQIIACE